MPKAMRSDTAATVADAFEDLGGDQRQRFGVVQLEAAGPAAASQLGGGEDEQLVLLAGGQVHWGS